MKTVSFCLLPGPFLWALLFVLTCLPNAPQAQTPLDSLKNRLPHSYGRDKLLVLNELVATCLSEQNPGEALRYARSAEALAATIITRENQLITAADYPLRPLASLQLGQVCLQLGRHQESRAAFEKAKAEALQLALPDVAEQAEQYILALEPMASDGDKKKKPFLGKALRDITQSIEKTSDDFSVAANLKLARMHESNRHYDKAIKKYELVVNQLRDQGDWEQVAELREHLANLLETQGLVQEAVNTLANVKQERERQGDHAGAASIQQKIDIVSLQAGIAPPPPPPPPAPVSPEALEIAKTEEVLRDIRIFAERAEDNRDFEQSLNYYKQYLATQQDLAEQERLQELALLEKAHHIDRQEQEIALLRQNEEISRLELAQNQIELKRQLIVKRSMGAGLVLSGTLVFSFFLLYRNKRRDHQKLSLAYQDLEQTKDQLKTAEHRIKGLLHQQVSGAVANELLSAEGAQSVQQKFVCIMFLDIRDFTPYVEGLSPEDIIEYQNEVLGFMIETVHRHNGIVNQILGDGFMATFGAPVSAGNDCQEAYLAAEEIIRTVKEKSDRGEIPATRIGIGLHAGQVVAGNVGTKDRKQYSITGNPVIIAARLEQLNKEFGSTLMLSKEVYDHLPKEMQIPLEFVEVTVKGTSKPVEVVLF